MSIRNPMQPLEHDGSQMRFRDNKIVRTIFDLGKLDMNDLRRLHEITPFPQTDWEQFYQLIGYSLNGYAELSLVSDESLAEANEAAKPHDAGGKQ